MKVSSNTGAARAAVSGFSVIEVDASGQQVSLGSSNVAGMLAGEQAANKVLKHVAKLASSAKGQADGVTALAANIAGRDQSDVAMWV